MKKDAVREPPPPAVMPLDRAKWAQELNLSTFTNAYYHYRDLASLSDCRSVLVVGPGQGVAVAILRWRGYTVETFDIDETFAPDHLGSVHDLSRFHAGQFDAVVASHVLEHLAESYLDTTIREIARVGRYALIYLPVAGRHAAVRLQPGFKGLDWQVTLDFFNYLERPDGVTPKYMANQHFWEVGRRGFRARDIRARLERSFEVLREYRNRDWIPSYNFVLRSRTEHGPK